MARERIFGAEHPAVSQTINRRGAVKRVMGDFAGARADFERAIGIEERILGPDHPQLADSVNNLGLVMREAFQDYAGARKLFERARRLYAHYGVEDPDVGRALVNLGTAVADEGDYAQGIQLMERGLLYLGRVFAPEHRNVWYAHLVLGRARPPAAEHADDPGLPVT